MTSNDRLSRLVPLLLMVVLALTACGGQPAQPAARQNDFAIVLPQIVIDINPEGVPSVAGIGPDTIKSITFGQVDISQMRVPKSSVELLTNSNIQHIEIRHKPDGLYLFSNGKPLPHLGWSNESFGSIGDLVSQFGVLQEPVAGIVKMVLPVAQRVGVDVVVKFPLKQGAAPIALADPSAQPALPAASAAEPASALARIIIKYDDQGVPSLMNISSRDLGKTLGFDTSQMELPPDTLKMLRDQGIQHIVVRTVPTGVLLWVNGKPLPNLVWSDEYLNNGTELYAQLFAADPALLKALNTLLPALRKMDAELVLQFPLAPGAAAIPVPKKP